MNVLVPGEREPRVVCLQPMFGPKTPDHLLIHQAEIECYQILKAVEVIEEEQPATTTTTPATPTAKLPPAPKVAVHTTSRQEQKQAAKYRRLRLLRKFSGDHLDPGDRETYADLLDLDRKWRVNFSERYLAAIDGKAQTTIHRRLEKLERFNVIRWTRGRWRGGDQAGVKSRVRLLSPDFWQFPEPGREAQP